MQSKNQRNQQQKNTNAMNNKQMNERRKIKSLPIIIIKLCRNLSLGLATKARACKSVGQEGTPGVTCHALGNAKEGEGKNPHIPTLGVKVPVDSRIFRERL